MDISEFPYITLQNYVAGNIT